MKTILLTSLIFFTFIMETSAQQGDTWVGKVYKVSGQWSITEEGGEHYFNLGDDFKTPSGPDLKLYFTKLKMSDIGDRDSVDKGGLFIGELESSKGAQRYKLPKNSNISDYKSLVIHCKAYSVVWGGVDIK